ncbi:MAG: pseudouridine synthase [Mariprofundaceae bacterium]|nr:pseudouridine synthase [Mariprofundaceae bacterium]
MKIKHSKARKASAANQNRQPPKDADAVQNPETKAPGKAPTRNPWPGKPVSGKSSSRRPTSTKKNTAKNSTGEQPGGERLNRYLASSGLCSRREADRRIEAGRININGETVQDMGRRVQPGDVILADGKPVEALTEHTYLLYHKPPGILCSRRDDRGRPLIYDVLDVAANVQSVGRLDMDSEGLLLLTDDGALARALTRPGANIPRVYRARITGHPDTDTLQKLRSGGLDIGRDEASDAWNVVVDAETNSHSWLTITIRRGRWREVRRTLDASGHKVRRLIRVEFATQRLGDLPPGAIRPLKTGELNQIKRTAGLQKTKND